MTTLLLIILASLLLAALALAGCAFFLLKEATARRMLLPLVAFSAGALLSAALLHLIPATLEQRPGDWVYFMVLAGFSFFFALEQFLHWHHSHRDPVGCRKPMTYLILLGDGLHNLLDGLAVGTAFVADHRLGWAACLATAAHELPQELGDFAVLVHGGWSKKRAILANLLSGAPFLAGGLAAYFASQAVDVSWLLPFAAGNFIYLAASDLVPEVKHHENARMNVVNFLCFAAGVGLLAALKLIEG